MTVLSIVISGGLFLSLVRIIAWKFLGLAFILLILKQSVEILVSETRFEMTVSRDLACLDSVLSSA